VKGVWAFAAAGWILISTMQLSAEERGVLGQGNVSCLTWSSDRDSSEASGRVAWVLGFITAFHQYGSRPERDISSGSSTEQITQAVDDHCAQHPSDNVYGAAVAVVEEYKRTREQ
jgi:hypothetical protein